MPIPKKGQSKDEFINACIPELIEEGKDRKQASAQCHSVWEQGLKESIPLRDIKVKAEYDPSNNLDSDILSDDFRYLSECYSQKESDFGGKENIIQASIKAIKRILELGKITFHTDQMKAGSIELLRESLNQIIQAGPCISPPHGEMIWKGKQKSIVRLSENEKLEDMGLLSSGQFVYGFIRFYSPESINLNQFAEKQDEHRMTESELTVTGDKTRLSYYKIREFIPFETPRQAEDPETFLKGDDRFFESTTLPKDWSLDDLTEEDLLKTHARMHDEAIKFSIDTGNPPGQGLIGSHKLVTSEFEKRKMDHLTLNELDKLSNEINLDKAVQLKQLINSLKEGFAIRKPFLSFLGESCKSGWGDKINIHVNWPGHDTKFIDLIRFNLQALLPPSMKESVHLVSSYKGPDTDIIPFAELSLKIIPTEKRKLMRMKESDLSDAALREARAGEIKAKRQAEQSRKEDKVEPFRFFSQITNVPGVSPPVASSIDDMIKNVNELWVKDKKFPQIQVDQKFGETRAQIHRAGDKVLIFNMDGKDVTELFPLIVEEAKAQDSDFIADANITHEPKKKIYTANIFDTVFMPEDIHNKPLSERRGLLEKLRSGKHLDIADRTLVKNEDDLKIALKNFSNLPGSQGAVIKLWDGKYSLEGSSQKWMRLKK